MGNHSQPQIRISVRNLVEFVMRSGDLDNRRTAGAKKEAMQTAPEDSETYGNLLPFRGDAAASGTGGHV